MKKLSLLLVGAMLSSMLASCTPTVSTSTPPQATPPQKSEAPASAAPSAEPAKEAPTNKQVKLSFWNFPNWKKIDDIPGKYEETVIAAFKEKYPNVDIEVTMIDFTSGPEKITSAIAGGTAPDIIYDAPGRIISWGNDGVLAPLNDMFTPELLKEVSPSLVEGCISGDNYWMYPSHTTPFMMAFNKEMLEKHGLLNMLNLEGDRRWTVEQYEALLRALKEKGEKGAVIFCKTQGGDQGTRAFIANLFGGSVVNADKTAYTLNDEKSVKALEWTKKMIDEGLLINGAAHDGTAAILEFNEGRVSHSILYSVVNIGTMERVNNFTPILVPYPSPSDPSLECLNAGYCVFDNGDPDKIAMAKEFIKFAVTDPVWGKKNAQATGCLSAFSSLNTDNGLTPDQEYSATMTKYYMPYYNTVKGFAAMRPFWFPALQAAFTGEKTPKAALDYFVEKANETMK